MAYALVNAVAVLIIACPCASDWRHRCRSWWVSAAARRGVLIRNAEALETLEKVDALIVDKTGTLTEGKPRLGVLIAARGTTKMKSFDSPLRLSERASTRWPRRS